MEIASIYILTEPGSEEVRYVGATIDRKSRKKSHMGIGGLRTSPRALWLMDLKNRGIKPVMQFLEDIPFEKGEEFKWKDREKFFIARYRSLGHRVLNANIGGTSGGRPTQETKSRISKSAKSRMTQQARDHLSEKLTGKPMHTEETKRIISESKLGKPRPPEVKAALLAGSLAWKQKMGFQAIIRCVKCGTIIKAVKAPKFLVAGIGHIHKKCQKLL